MSLKSFPKESQDRQVVWVLEDKVINDVINDKDAKQILLDDSIQVVRYPVRNFDKMRSPVLMKLDQQGLLKPNQLLVMGSDESIDAEYVEIDKAIETFMDTAIRKAKSYIRFYSALGATSISYKEKQNENSNKKAEAAANVKEKVTNVSGEGNIILERKLNELASVIQTFEARMPDIVLAEKILKEEKLDKDTHCVSDLKIFKDGGNPKSTDIILNSNFHDSQSMKLVLNMSIDIPVISPKDNTMGKMQNKRNTNLSLFSLGSKLELAKKVQRDYVFNLTICY